MLNIEEPKSGYLWSLTAQECYIIKNIYVRCFLYNATKTIVIGLWYWRLFDTEISYSEKCSVFQCWESELMLSLRFLPLINWKKKKKTPLPKKQLLIESNKERGREWCSSSSKTCLLIRIYQIIFFFLKKRMFTSQPWSILWETEPRYLQ